MRLQNILFLLILFCVSTGALLQTSCSQPVDPKRESARATLRTFLDALQKHQDGITPDPLKEAVKCLDLQDFPPSQRAVQGVEISAQLKEVITSVPDLNIDAAPDEKNGEPYDVFPSAPGKIIIARQSSGEWLFTKDTVLNLPLTIAAIREKTPETIPPAKNLVAKVPPPVPWTLQDWILLITPEQWLKLLLLVLLGLIFWHAVKFLARLTLGKILKQRYQYLTEKQIGKLYSPIGLFAFVIFLHLGLPVVGLTKEVLPVMQTTTFLLISLAVTWLVSRVVGIIASQLKQKARETNLKSDDLLVPFITTIVRIVIVIVAAIWMAGNLGFDVTSIIAGLGIGGIAIALASQETLSNFFGSLVLLIEQPFTADDRIEIAGVKGTVQEVGLRSTKILTSDNSMITMPNASIAKSNIINQGVKISPRWSIKLLVPYQNGAAKVEKLCDGIQEIIEISETLDSENFKIKLFDVLPAALELRLQITFKVDEYDFEVNARHLFIMDLLRLADKLEIQLEVPN